MHPPNLAQITIIGTGLLGGSLGLALREQGYRGRLVGVGRSPGTLRKAEQAGCIDAGYTELAPAVADAGLIVLATPVSAIGGYLQKLAELETAQAVITDVGSTKRHIVETAESVLPRPEQFVGSHPMAGSECHGPDAARGDLFCGKPVIVTPTERTAPAAIKTVSELWTALGMCAVTMTPAQHDRVVARVSHVPHLVAALLVKLAEADSGLTIASTGFGSTTRVAAGDAGLWTDIFLDNREDVLTAVHEYQAMLAGFREALQTGDRARIEGVLAEAQRVRSSWNEDGAATTSVIED